MYFLIFGLLFLNIVTFSVGKKVSLDDYCTPDKTNTPCQYKCAKSSSCGAKGKDYKPFSNEDKEFILDQHNVYRNDVANGKYTSRQCKTASEMEVLSWCKECEFVVGCWMKQCYWGHDKTRKTHDGQALGQNLYTHRSTDPKDDESMVLYKHATTDWFGETKDFRAGIVAKFADTKEMIGHATALLWGKSKYIGCAYQKYVEGGMFKIIVGCNYLPRGNIVGREVYTEGATASKCTTKNSKYTGLCGQQRPMKDDDFVPPINLSRADRIMTVYIIYILGLAFAYLMIV